MREEQVKTLHVIKQKRQCWCVVKSEGGIKLATEQ